MKKVLFIEDDKVLRENTAELLEIANYEVITAPNGRIGANLAKEELPDVVVCDIMMPEMDGYAVLKSLGEDTSTQNIPFIFLSAKTEHQDIRRGMNLGADDYLTKPFEEEELISAIESRLAKTAILKNRNPTPETPAEIETRQEIGSLDELREFMRGFEMQSYKKGESIFEAGKQGNRFFMLDKGVVKTHRMDEQGKELITAIFKEGDFFGKASFSIEETYEEFATAMEDSKIHSIPKSELRKILMENSKIALDLIEILGKNIEGAKAQLFEMAYASVRKKTANTILMFSRRIKKHPMHSIRISRSDLASVAGMAPESLIRTLSEFKKMGLIEIEGRNIKLLDVEGLKQVK